MSEIESLMRQYFAYKDKGREVRQQRNQFMETYKCLTPYQPYQDNEMTCIDQAIESVYGTRWHNLCASCKTRHRFFLERKELSTKQSATLSKVRRRLATNAPSKEGE